MPLSPPDGPSGGSPAALSAHLAVIEDALQRAVGEATSPLVAASRYVMGWEDAQGLPASNGGKRLRPALCLFAAEALGGRIEDAMPGAVAIELVHNFSLVHDEVQDHDYERHHRPTIWARLGEGQAINVGDYLYSRAIRALADGPGDASRRMRALTKLHDAIDRMIEGQWRDIAFESRDSVSADEYLGMVAGKTGALLGAPLEIGAVLAGMDSGDAALLGEWGRAVGLAFQIQDDYLGIWGDPGETGKSNTGDITRKKKTLPVIYGLADAAARSTISTAYARSVVTPTDVENIVTALDACGAAEACREQAREHTASAERRLATLELSAQQTAQFAAIADYLINRRT